MRSYGDFIASKTPRAAAVGIEPKPMPAHLFDFQMACIAHNLRAGRAGLFLDTGLGKTACQLEWCRQAASASNGRALILTPLAVAWQIQREAEKFGYESRVVRSADDVGNGINICNYDRIDRLNPAAFGAVSLDESSILKNFTGKTTHALTAMFAQHRFRLSASATPAPNDHMELGQHAEFLGIMPSNEMLMRWFTADQTQMGRYRLKHHGVTTFWRWMASWARMAESPADLGFDASAFVMPPLNVHKHRVENAAPVDGGELFGVSQVSATDMHRIKRQTAESRSRLAADLVTAEPAEPWVVWCDTNYEADAILSALNGTPGVAEVRGSQTADEKESALRNFADGSIRVLVTKPSVCGFGLNWQHCARTVFVGRSFSYESWYQAVRRLWRFGQKRAVECHVVLAEGEDAIARVIDRKASDHADMKAAMARAMRESESGNATRKPYNPNHIGGMPTWLRSAA